MKVGRNDPCPCGSGKKYKHCCYAKDSVKHELPEPEPAASDEATDTDEHNEPAHAHRKDRTHFKGQDKGRAHAPTTAAARGGQRGS